MGRIKRYHLVFIMVMILANAYCSDAGMSFIRNYLPREYRASRQNWAIAQDHRGIMYFGNNDGLLEYDGENWRLIKLPGVKAIAIDSVERIWLGLENDMGYMEPDARGNLHFRSLRFKIPEIRRHRSTVLHICIFGNKVIFQTSDELLIYENGQFKVIPSESGFQNMFYVNDKLFVRERDNGLLYLEDDKLIVIRGGDIFANERISAMLPYTGNQILIISRIKGMYVYSPEYGTTFRKPGYFSAADSFLIKNQADCAALLSNGDIAVGTVTGGIVVFNSEGVVRNSYNINTGLQDNTIYFLYPDSNDQLWAVLDKGISLVQNNLPFRFFTEQNNLNGTPVCLKYFNNRFYVGTSQYLHLQNSQGNFEIIQGTGGQNNCLLEANGSLLLAKSPGIYEIKNDIAIPVNGSGDRTYLTLETLRNNPFYVLAGAYDGLYLLERRNSGWIVKGVLKGFFKTVYSLKEDLNGEFWVSTSTDLFKLTIDSSFSKVISSVRFSVAQGLPADHAYPIKLNSGELVFSTVRGIYKYERDANKFVIHPDFKMLRGEVMPFVQISNGDIWFNESLDDGTFEKGVLKFDGNRYVIYKTPFLKFTDAGCGNSPYNILVAPDSAVFIGTTSALLQYNRETAPRKNSQFHTLLRRVLQGDSLLFGGYESDSVDFQNRGGITIPFSHDNWIFYFAATFYEDSERNQYSYRLVGSDSAWSAWSGDHKKEYTYLKEGRYIFEVKSRNMYQKTGTTASYSFEILSPWYRTWLAYILYVVFAIFFIWLIVRLYVRRLMRLKAQLEKTVIERTAEVVAQKKQIEKAHGEITASINYAKYIQSSVFPKSDQLASCLGDHFIFHKPVEIVSGDFYWVSKRDNRIVVVAADCTGHGVPGAFMSMLGITLLDEIVNKRNITNPGIILNRLRDEVIESLQQKGKKGEQKDGMDIAVCTIDKVSSRMQFAGANNPVYQIRSSSVTGSVTNGLETDSHVELTEIKGDRMPIGIFDEMGEFKVHEIPVLEGDTYYLFTDGFPDQFGGQKRRKFSYKQFRNLLIKIQPLSMDDQKTFLENSLNEWKGSEGQTDDILVIGFRIN